ncbi:hypothetical protein BJX63DRAFT_398376 [Aspergillus granulosus]|uniref:Uncharacterized protein n=1 Tax=Aspergillus granulosus TaxID=176169 RepID=A0ABR4H8J9_9EURO
MTPFNGYFYHHPNSEKDDLSGLISMSAEGRLLARWVFLDSQMNEMQRAVGRMPRTSCMSGPFDLIDNGPYLTLHDTQRWMD